jgi:hypothetical protein
VRAYPRYEFTLSDDATGLIQIEPVEVTGHGHEEPDPRLRCQCSKVKDQCRQRATQEDLLCDGCRVTETVCVALRVAGVLTMSHGQLTQLETSWTT